MSTPYLTAVYMNGEYKVAQYGRYDGGPEKAGAYIVRVLSSVKLDRLKKAISECRFATEEEMEKIKAHMEVLEWQHPEMHEKVGSHILSMILFDNVRVLDNRYDFVKANRLLMGFVWCYVIDFDTGTFEIFKGINEEPLSENERFYLDGYVGEIGNYPPKKVVEFSLDDLPSEESLADIEY